MIALTVAGAVAVAVLVWSERSHPLVRRIAKPTASACFVATAVVGGAIDTGYGRWVLIALVLSAAGDVALLGRSSASFLAGLGSFLLGHVAYVVAFAVRGVDGPTTAVAVGVAVLPAALVVRWLWSHLSPAMRSPVIAYAAVISTMVAFALGTVVEETDLRILVAALGFYCSDLAVARNRFVAPGFVNRLWGLPLYYAAQFLFAWTVVT